MGGKGTTSERTGRASNVDAQWEPSPGVCRGGRGDGGSSATAHPGLHSFAWEVFIVVGFVFFLSAHIWDFALFSFSRYFLACTSKELLRAEGKERLDIGAACVSAQGHVQAQQLHAGRSWLGRGRRAMVWQLSGCVCGVGQGAGCMGVCVCMHWGGQGRCVWGVDRCGAWAASWQGRHLPLHKGAAVQE